MDSFSQSRRMKRRPDGPIRFRSNFRNTIYDVMRSRGWIETEHEVEWDFLWMDREWVYADLDNLHLEPWQRVNHFRNGRELCRKDLLSKNIKRVRKEYEKEGNFEMVTRYDFAPTTFVLPGDYALFVEEFKKIPQGTSTISGVGSVVSSNPLQASTTTSTGTWIMKPVGRSQGKGIFLFTKLSQIQQWKSDSRWKPDNPAVESYVVQRYIANPYVIGGKKFDMRLYALVMSFSPLTVYIYRAGFCRFSASRYSNEDKDVMNNFVHLTNVAIQKGSADYNADTGGKWELSRLKQFLTSRHGREATDRCFSGMQDIMLLALQAVAKTMMSSKQCFELYGYDILIDETLKPWLIEVNASPSLTANTREDYDLKFKLLHDVLDLVDMEGRRENSGEHGHSAAHVNTSVSLNTGISGGVTRISSSEPQISSFQQNISVPPIHMGGFDLVWKEGPIPVPTGSSSMFGRTSTYGTMLGADFDKRLNTFVTNTINPSIGPTLNMTDTDKLSRKTETIREASQMAVAFATSSSKQASSLSTSGVISSSSSTSASLQTQQPNLINRPGLSGMISAFKNSIRDVKDRPPSRSGFVTRGKNEDQGDSQVLSASMIASSSSIGERQRPWTVNSTQKRPSTRSVNEIARPVENL